MQQLQALEDWLAIYIEACASRYLRCLLVAARCDDESPLLMKRGKDPIWKHEASLRARITFSHALSFTTHLLSAEEDVEVIGIFYGYWFNRHFVVLAWLRRGENSSSQTLM